MIPLPSHCKSCVLYPEHRNGLGFSQLEGAGTNGVLVVAEALGEWEEIDGLPLRPQAPAGSVFTKSLRWQGLDRTEFTLTNIVRCRPPKNYLDGAPYEREAIDHCRQYLDAVIAERKPKCILALGGIALRELTGLSGEKRTISHLRGFVLNSRYNIPLVATYHPAFIVRGAAHLLGVVIRDVKLATSVAAQGIPKRPETNYILSPTPDEVRQWFRRQSPDNPLPLDIETSLFEKDDVDFAQNATITQIQFSSGVGQAIVMPFLSPYFDAISEVLAGPNPKWTWNGRNFDIPILKAAGFIVNGEHHDLMLAFKHLQPDFDSESRLMSLQSCTSFYDPYFGPWKHESSVDLPLYGAKDVDSTRRNGEGLMRDLHKRGLWRGYYEHKFKLKDVLDDLGKRGLPVDEIQQTEFRTTVLAESEKLNSELQQHVPSELTDFHPKQGYKVVPKPIKELVAANISLSTDQIAAKVKSELGYDYRPFGENGSATLRWCKALPFNANSSQQLLRYIKFRKYKVPRKWGDDKETTGKDALEKLYHATGDKVLGLTLQIRKMNKVVSAFTAGNWVPRSNGRVHSTFGFTGTGQKNSVRPNIQQFPVHGELAKKFKKMIRAEDGHTFVSLDYRSFHARSLGWVSLDENYYKLADFDVHSFVTAHFVKLPVANELLRFPDELLRAELSSIKSQYEEIRDQKAKRAILGLGFHMGVNKLYIMNADSFNPSIEEVKLLAGKSWDRWDDEKRQKYVNKYGLAEAKKLVMLIQNLFPRAFSQFPQEIEDRIRRVTKCYLKSPAGHNRWFFDLNLEEAVAFLPANLAHCHIDDCANRLHAAGYLDRFQLVNWIHDSFLFHCPSELVEECVQIVREDMQRPSDVLENELGRFQCSVDAKVGPHMAEMNKL